MGSKLKEAINKEVKLHGARFLLYPFVFFCFGLYGVIWESPSLDDYYYCEGEVEYVEFVRDEYFKSFEGISNGYYLKLKKYTNKFEIYYNSDRAIIRKYLKSNYPQKAEIWFDKKDGVAQLKLNNEIILNYTFWDRFGGPLIFIILGILPMPLVFLAIKKYPEEFGMENIVR